MSCSMTTFEFTKETFEGFYQMFHCERCNKCEQEVGRVRLYDYDVQKISKYLGITEDEFREYYTYTVNKMVDNRLVRETYMPTPCPFFDGEGCLIHNCSPEICIQFPFNQPVPCKNKKGEIVRVLTINTGCPAGKKLAEKFAINPETVGVG